MIKTPTNLTNLLSICHRKSLDHSVNVLISELLSWSCWCDDESLVPSSSSIHSRRTILIRTHRGAHFFVEYVFDCPFPGIRVESRWCQPQRGDKDQQNDDKDLDSILPLYECILVFIPLITSVIFSRLCSHICFSLPCLVECMTRGTYISLD